MTLELAERPTHALLEAARTRAAEAGLSYAGGPSPHDAWALGELDGAQRRGASNGWRAHGISS